MIEYFVFFCFGENEKFMVYIVVDGVCIGGYGNCFEVYMIKGV